MAKGRGERGARGATGRRGATGQAGPAASKAQILAAVNDQFGEIQKQISAQLVRTGQIQADLDRHRGETAALRQQLKQIHSLLKEIVQTFDD